MINIIRDHKLNMLNIIRDHNLIKFMIPNYINHIKFFGSCSHRTTTPLVPVLRELLHPWLLFSENSYTPGSCS